MTTNKRPFDADVMAHLIRKYDTLIFEEIRKYDCDPHKTYCEFLGSFHFTIITESLTPEGVLLVLNSFMQESCEMLKRKVEEDKLNDLD